MDELIIPHRAFIFIGLMDLGISLVWPNPPSWEPFSGSWTIVTIMTVAGLLVGLIRRFTSAAQLDVFEAVDNGRLGVFGAKGRFPTLRMVRITDKYRLSVVIWLYLSDNAQMSCQEQAKFASDNRKLHCNRLLTSFIESKCWKSVVSRRKMSLLPQVFVQLLRKPRKGRPGKDSRRARFSSYILAA